MKLFKIKREKDKTKTEWHNICVWGKKAEIAEQYVKKGSKLYLEGKITSRNYESDGITKYITEIVLGMYDGDLKMLDSKGNGSQEQASTPSDNVGDSDLPF